MDADFIQGLKNVRENLDISLPGKPCEQYNSICISSRDSSPVEILTQILFLLQIVYITVQTFQYNINLCFPCNTAPYFCSAFYILALI